MKIDQLIYLDDVSKTHSITHTAQRFFITQQALSISLKKLEDEFDSTFLQRSNHGVTLTQAGYIFLEKTRPIIDVYHDVKKELAEQTFNGYMDDVLPDGVLKIYAHTRVLIPLLTDVLQKFTRKYPNVQIILNEKQNLDIIDAISSGEGDIGILFVPDALISHGANFDYKLPEDVEVTELFSDDLIVCCNKNHPITEIKDLNIDNFPDFPVVRYDSNPVIRMIGREFSDQHIIHANQYFSNNPAFHDAMVESGNAITVITSFEFRKLYFKDNDLTAIPLKTDFHSSISTVLPKKTKLSVITESFLKILHDYDFYSI